MAKAKTIKQLSFTMPNMAGPLSEVPAAIASVKVNINFVCGYEMENNGYFIRYHSGRQASASTPSASPGFGQGRSRCFQLHPASSDLKRPRLLAA